MRSVRARVCDPTGPAWVRRVIPTLAATLIVLSPFAPVLEGLRATGMLLGAALFFSRKMIRVRFRPRDACVAIDEGSIVIEEAGLLDQAIRAPDVIAASTARTPDGVALALVRKGSPERPVLLDFESEAQLDAVRRALGLGHYGFGEVGWPTRVRSAAFEGSTALAAAWLAMALCAASDLPLIGLTMALVVVPITVVALLAASVQEPHRPRVMLTASGIRLTHLPAWIVPVPYPDVRASDVNEAGVLLTTDAGLVMIPMEKSWPEERRHVVAQIDSAAARARGEGPEPPALPYPLARLAARGESERAWLERVDTAAASLASREATGAYRASDLDPADLWAALENPDTPARVRAAAARVLARISPRDARARIAGRLACERDTQARACIRVAMEEDIDTAARRLERLGLSRI